MRGCGVLTFLMEASMRNPVFSRGAFFAGAVLFVAPALDMIFSARTPDVVHAIFGTVGLALLAISAAAGDVWPAGGSRSRSHWR